VPQPAAVMAAASRIRPKLRLIPVGRNAADAGSRNRRRPGRRRGELAAAYRDQPGIANPARVYDALLGGKDNYAADRATGHCQVTSGGASLTSIWEVAPIG
jgi:hypothetical protein